MPKSFEYAYLHAKGEYVLAIGSDDGILPWALEVLDEVVPMKKLFSGREVFMHGPALMAGSNTSLLYPKHIKRVNITWGT